jgi:hypothetical protein
LVHDALSAAFKATATMWRARPRDRAEIERIALAAAEDFLAHELVGSPLRDVALARARDDVRAVLAWSLADDEWDFALAEQPFGDGDPEAWAPLVIDVDGHRMSLRGRIDRVDFAHLTRGARAIDYKRSKRKALDTTRELGETAFQVPLYALAASRATDRPTSEGLYVPTGARDLRVGFRGKEAFATKWAALLREEGALTVVERLAARVVIEMRNGALAPVPRDANACAHCDVRGGCRKPRFAVAPDDAESAG